jgi:hypothetical protein
MVTRKEIESDTQKAMNLAGYMFDDHEEMLQWFNTTNNTFMGFTPMEAIEQGKAHAVITFLEQSLGMELGSAF